MFSQSFTAGQAVQLGGSRPTRPTHNTITGATATKSKVSLALVTSFIYWYQGVLRTHRRVHPESVRILMEAASASLTVSFTDCIRFWALWTNISVAWSGNKGK